MICPECGQPLAPRILSRGRPSKFCTVAHQRAYHDRQAARGKVLVSLAQVWRRGKKRGGVDAKYAFAELCALLDRYNAEDRAKGRRPDLIVSTKRRALWSQADLG